jgi:probable addiction module antidote protein
MTVHTTKWDVVDHLDSKEAILAYLEAVFEDGDSELIAAALNDVARAKGITNDPALTFDSDIVGVIRTLKALGLQLTARAA